MCTAATRMTDASDDKRDFFVSFTQADRAWATWVAWALEGAGYSVFFQDWDFQGNFVLEMDKAHARSRRTIAVLSPDYLTSRFAAPEWAARGGGLTGANDRGGQSRGGTMRRDQPRATKQPGSARSLGSGWFPAHGIRPNPALRLTERRRRSRVPGGRRAHLGNVG
jgi:hypothetical protein